MRRGGLAAFHAAHELTLRAHGPAAPRKLAALAAAAGKVPSARAVDAYGRAFMEALRRPATRAGHASVLRRVLRSLRGALPPVERAELAEAIAGYARGLVPRVVPLTLLRHHVRSRGIAHLAGQTYLEPDPGELLLRNRA
jgi:uncharacterized protein YbgA (DUF1722 family)